MGYHTKKIKRGELGEVSKIDEEFAEFHDALDQKNAIMALLELSDLIGAIELYTKNHFNIDLEGLIIMRKATESAFKDGTRK
ncbi:MAG: hypothetical protein NTZ48_05615 [Candidatus Omnitrophica bacterium]|nr:hypothetical protein [Candidatus Omnitrophota bacterium]